MEKRVPPPPRRRPDWQGLSRQKLEILLKNKIRNIRSHFQFYIWIFWQSPNCIKNDPCDVIKWGRLEEKWERNPIKKRWIIPHFYYVTRIIFDTIWALSLFVNTPYLAFLDKQWEIAILKDIQNCYIRRYNASRVGVKIDKPLNQQTFDCTNFVLRP